MATGCPVPSGNTCDKNVHPDCPAGEHCWIHCNCEQPEEAREEDKIHKRVAWFDGDD